MNNNKTNSEKQQTTQSRHGAHSIQMASAHVNACPYFQMDNFFFFYDLSLLINVELWQPVAPMEASQQKSAGCGNKSSDNQLVRQWHVLLPPFDWPCVICRCHKIKKRRSKKRKRNENKEANGCNAIRHDGLLVLCWAIHSQTPQCNSTIPSQCEI